MILFMSRFNLVLTPVSKEASAPLKNLLLKRIEDVRQELAIRAGMLTDEVRSPKKFEHALQRWAERVECYSIPPIMNTLLDAIEACKKAQQEGGHLSLDTMHALYARLFLFLEKQMTLKMQEIPFRNVTSEEIPPRYRSSEQFLHLDSLRENPVPILTSERVKPSRIGEVNPAEQDIARCIGADIHIAESTENLRDAMMQWIPSANKQQLQDVGLQLSSILGLISIVMETPIGRTNSLLRTKRDSYEAVLVLLLKELERYLL